MQFLRPTIPVLSLGVFLALFGTGCSTVPETGRKQLNMFSSQEEMKLGLTEFDKMKKDVPIS